MWVRMGETEPSGRAASSHTKALECIAGGGGPTLNHRVCHRLMAALLS